MRRLGLLALFLCIISSASAQSIGFTDTALESINAQNASQVAHLWSEGIGYGGAPYWSQDSQILYFDTINGVKEYRMDDVEHPRFLDQLPFPQAAFDRKIPDPIATSPDGRYIVHQEVKADDERSATYAIEDTASGEVIKRIPGDATVMRTYSAIIFIPQFYDDGLLFLRNAALYRWNPTTDTEELLFENFIDLSISPNGHFAVTYAIYPTLNNDSEFQIWDLQSAPAQKLYEHTFPAMDAWHSIAFSPDGQQVATGGSNNNIRLWDFSTGAVRYTETKPPGEYGEQEVIDLAYSADSRLVAGCINTVANKFDVIVVDAKRGETLATIGGYSSTGNSLCGSVSFDANDQMVWFGGADGSLRGWSIDALIGLKDTTIDTAERIFTGHTDSVMSLAISPDGRQMATASWDKTIKLWDYATGQVIQTLDEHTAPVWGVSFSPDGKELATSAEDGTIRIWDLETNQETILAIVTGEREYQEPKPLVTDLEFSPDGSVLAGSEFNGQIHIWDVQRRIELALLDANDTVWHLAFNQAGTLIATASTVGTVKLWGVEK
jgi:WD40 repeat protein